MKHEGNAEWDSAVGSVFALPLERPIVVCLTKQKALLDREL
jgi:hypothetical protein